MHKVTIALLNWNGKHLLERFLPSVVSYSEGAHIAVIDNGSTDDSIDFISKFYPQIEIIKLDQNYGFAQGYNLGFKHIKSEYVVLLNTDIELTQGWLKPLLDFMEENPKVAIIQPKILDYNNRKNFEYAGAAGGFIDLLGYPFCRGRIFFSIERDYGQYDNTCQVFWVAGACMIIRKSVFDQLKGFCSDFFAHMEEIDLCWRAHRSGFKVIILPQSYVYHVGGATLSMKSSRKTFLNFRNNYILILRNLPLRIVMLILVFRFILDWISIILFLVRRSIPEALAVLKAQFAFIMRVFYYIKNRPILPYYFKNFVYKRPIVFEYFLFNKRYFWQLRQDLFGVFFNSNQK